MRKFISICIGLFAIICPLALIGCSVGRTGEDISNLYQIVKDNHVDSESGYNDFFGDDYTINITYVNRITDITLATATSSNAKNLYTLTKVYNPLFKAIFRYFENWNESFYANADKITRSELGELYNKLNQLNLSLIDLSDAKLRMEDAVVLNGVDNVSSNYITTYLYRINLVVEDSIDFVQYFRDLHMKYIFRDDTLSTNAVSRTIDDNNLTLARIIYVDNIRPFNLQNGEYKICDLSALVRAYNSGNSYARLDIIAELDKDLSDATINALQQLNDPTKLTQVREYMHYSNIMQQDIITLNQIFEDIDYYKLSLYRFGLLEGGVDNYYIGLSYLDKLSYEFLDNLLNFVDNSFMLSYNNLT